MEEIEKVLFTEEQINEKVKKIAADICEDFKGQSSIVGVSVLLGSVIFFSDLVREISKLNGPRILFDLVKVSSYIGHESSGKVKLSLDLHHNVEGRDILLVEDIVDTGTSLNYLIQYLKEVKGAKSVKICSLLSKPAERKADVKIDYLGFEVPPEFVVGYGLDYKQKYRDLPYIAILKKEVYE